MTPDFILYTQHGWADTYRRIAVLARALATPHTRIFTPNQGYLRTWIGMEPLIHDLETHVADTIQRYPTTPIRLIGHSMGGLLWIEVLHRHPDWWYRVHSLVLLGSPVGGAHYARLIDPLGMGIGAAKDLGKNRRTMAEIVAATIPTLMIMSDRAFGFDDTVSVESTKFAYSHYICLPGFMHKTTRNHPMVVDLIQQFWANPTVADPPEASLSHHIVRRIRSIPGITDAPWGHFHMATPIIRFRDGLSIRLWESPIRTQHVYVASSSEQCLYSGFVGWFHTPLLAEAIAGIRREYVEHVVS